MNIKQLNSIAGSDWIEEMGQNKDKSFWVSVKIPVFCECNGWYENHKSFTDFREMKRFVKIHC
jgi:hypothetical protein